MYEDPYLPKNQSNQNSPMSSNQNSPFLNSPSRSPALPPRNLGQTNFAKQTPPSQGLMYPGIII